MKSEMGRRGLVAGQDKSMMLCSFIESNLDRIIGEWESFARTLLPAAASMSAVALRNHSREILLAIVKDMRTPQSPGERHDKSQQMRVLPGTPETAAVAHGAIRQLEGFNLPQLFGEFRALRATVLRLWREAEGTDSATEDAIEEIARFNEGIDQALAESVERYAENVRASRELFVAMVGHDLRGPLWTIEGSTHLLRRPKASEDMRGQALDRIERSSRVMERLIADLLTYSRTQLAGRIPLERKACDFGQLCRHAIDSMRASYPERSFELELGGDMSLNGDEVRLDQVLANLLHNAAQHGEQDQAISLSAIGELGRITVKVWNAGVIPGDSLTVIFEPLSRRTDQQGARDRWKTSLGLGLFIVREIVRAHDGSIRVESSAEAGTTFTVELPRGTAGR
jgi:signal transduction histidine kinase